MYYSITKSSRSFFLISFLFLIETCLGVLLSYVIQSLDKNSINVNTIHHSIDLAKLRQQQSKALFEVGENLNSVVAAAKKIKSLIVVNLGANDILEKNTDIVLGLVWQLVRAHLLKDVNLVSRPELIRLLHKGETLRDLLDMPSEQLLLRWANFHLKRAGFKSISNFSTDINDGRAYLVLLSQVIPRSLDREVIFEALEADDAEKRAETIIDIADKIDCKRFVSQKDILTGQARLNLAFTADIFNKYIGIVLPTDEEVRSLYERVEDLEQENTELRETLEERDNDMKQLIEQMERLKNDWISKDNEKTEALKRQIQQLMSDHQHQMELQRKKSFEDVEGRESELKSIIDSVKAKAKQQVYQLESQLETSRQQMTRDLNNLKRSLEDFLLSNDIIEGIDPEMTPHEEIVSVLQDHLVKVLEAFYEQNDRNKKLDTKLQHLEKVNAVIGDKIQAYAEGLIDEKKKKKSALKGLW